MEKMGVKALGQNASAVIRQVEASGEGVEITIQGRSVARIVPLANKTRKVFISSDEAAAILSDLLGGDAAWEREIHKSRENDSIEDPWERHSTS